MTASEELTVIVGQGGVAGNSGRAGNFTGSEKPTYGGGGASLYDNTPGVRTGWAGGSGGGRSAIREATPTGSNIAGEFLTAGGGGGSGDGTCGVRQVGGAGGGESGLAGTCSFGGTCTEASGRGGTPTAGGAAGVGRSSDAARTPTAGSQFQGGNGGCWVDSAPGQECGGGGGGGYFGGGGATVGFDRYDASAGGGSGYVAASVTSPVLLAGTETTPPNVSDAHYRPGIGSGGGPGSTDLLSASGGNGLVVIQTKTPPPPGYAVSKVADRSEAGPGDVVRYSVTVTVTNTGGTDSVAASFADDLSDVLTKADWVGFVGDAQGAVFDSPELTWSGTVVKGSPVTISYEVKVKAGVSGQFTNMVTAGDGQEVPPVIVKISGYAVSKVADRSEAGPGDVVRYSVTVTNTGGTDSVAASFADDLSDVLTKADWVGFVGDAQGAVFDSPSLSWSGDVLKGSPVTISYEVRVKAGASGQFTNVVITGDGQEVPPVVVKITKADNEVPPVEIPGDGSNPITGLPDTGTNELMIAAVGLLVLLGGAALLLFSRRRNSVG